MLSRTLHRAFRARAPLFSAPRLFSSGAAGPSAACASSAAAAVAASASPAGACVTALDVAAEGAPLLKPQFDYRAIRAQADAYKASMDARRYTSVDVNVLTQLIDAR